MINRDNCAVVVAGGKNSRLGKRTTVSRSGAVKEIPSSFLISVLCKRLFDRCVIATARLSIIERQCRVNN